MRLPLRIVRAGLDVAWWLIAPHPMVLSSLYWLVPFVYDWPSLA